MHDVTPGGDLPPEPAPRPYNWPTCPQCGRRRSTFCPICQTAGAEFPPAEYAPRAAELDEETGKRNEAVAAPANQGGTNEEVLLMCPTCDEAFTPRFYRQCELCGYHFAGGIETGEQPPELAGRPLWVLAGMILLGCALWAYFWMILR